MTRTFKSLAAVTAVGLIAGCGGGASTPIAPVQQSPVTSAPASTQGSTRGSMTLVVRSRKNAKQLSFGSRKPQYVSPATSGILATFVDTTSQINGASRSRRGQISNASPSPVPTSTPTTTYQGYTLTPGATETAGSPASCTALQSDNSYTCTLFFALTASHSYTTTLTAYDYAQSATTGVVASDPTANAPAANALSTHTQSITISPNTSNTFDFTLEGIVEGFNVTPQYVGTSGTLAATFTSTFTALDADNFAIDKVDSTTSFAYGTQNAGPFVENTSFTVGALDESTCTTTPCITTTAAPVANPGTEAVSYAYNGTGDPGDPGTAQQLPYYGVITLTGPAGYTGFPSGPVGKTTYAGTAYLVPIFGYVDQGNSAKNGTASVAFTSPSQSIMGYATQFHIPTTAAKQDGTGYTIDSSSCANAGKDSSKPAVTGPVATFGTPVYTANYGISFLISATQYGGTCTVTVHDGATPDDVDTISISNTNSGQPITVPSPGPKYSPNARFR